METTQSPRAPQAQPMTHAEAWEKWHDWNALQMRPLTDWFCRATAAAPGQAVVDVACGTGLPSLALAELVAPSGKVLATDLAPEMVDVVTRAARARKLDNLEARTMSAESLEAADASVDIVTCAFGLMFCSDPTRAAAEMHRVLRPGGRFAVAVWDLPEKNPLFTTVFGAAAEVLKLPPPDPKAPSMFGLGAPGALSDVLRAGGFSSFELEPRPLTFELSSLDEYWTVMSDMAPPLRSAKATLPDGELARLRRAVDEAAAPFVIDGRVRLTATPLTATGRK